MLEVVSNNRERGKLTERTRQEVARHFRAHQGGIAAAEACLALLVPAMTSEKSTTHHAARDPI